MQNANHKRFGHLVVLWGDLEGSAMMVVLLIPSSTDAVEEEYILNTQPANLISFFTLAPINSCVIEFSEPIWSLQQLQGLNR